MTEQTETDRRPAQLHRLREERFEALIIGGGINGAGLARDLALRGFQVALVEKGDYASGTSSASTKLIHGGLRYLENFDFRLVFEACRERRTLRRIAPHLVHPLPFLIPVYQGDPRPLWMVRAGMWLYDLLALFRNTGRHSILAPQVALEREPELHPEGLSGVALYWDCRMDDARLCLENILGATAAGAVTANYLPVVELLREAGRSAGVRVRDTESGAEFIIRAKVVINATGPWLEQVCALAGDHGVKLRPTRGTHILVPRINHGEEALYLTAGGDGRLFFVIPWGELSLIGTTDDDDRGDPDRVVATEADIAYLLAESRRHLRNVGLQRRDVVASFSGLRALAIDDAANTGRTSREHRIYTDASGLISIAGGKYTTYRAVAAELADLVARRLGKYGAELTATLPLPGGATGKFSRYVAQQTPLLARRYGCADATVRRLLGIYGSRTEAVLALTAAEPELLQPVVAGSTLLAAQVVFAAMSEQARTPEDVLRRRTPLALERGCGMAELAAVSRLLAQRLGTTTATQQQWETDYRHKYKDIDDEN
ncbi:MAG: glycerol-3-phosphate dehydrogenase [Desulfuromonadales bacterium]|nr:glycerol-3-phosphate dehydrogenase [Desulfuromonadales bacterium]